MPLIQINADLKRVAEALEKIRDLLKIAVGPPPELNIERSDLEDLHVLTYEGVKEDDEWGNYGPRTNYR
jgi:hypothetical protein